MNEETKADQAENGQQNPTPVDAGMEITLKMPLGAVNVILGTLDKNPLGVSVMQMSALINALSTQTKNQVEAHQLAEHQTAKNPAPGRVKRR